MALQTINIGASANDGSGDPLRTAMDKINENFQALNLGVFNVKDLAYGAVGDGVTDDTAEIQAAFDACPDGATVYLPSGEYKITAKITATGKSINVIGQHRLKSVIIAYDCDGIELTHSDVDSGQTIKDFSLLTTKKGTRTGLKITGSNSVSPNLIIENVNLQGADRFFGVTWPGESNANELTWLTGIHLVNCDHAEIRANLRAQERSYLDSFPYESIGLLLDSCTIIDIYKPEIYRFKTGIKIIGQSEGIKTFGGGIVANYYGVYGDMAAPCNDHGFNDTHFSNVKGDILLNPDGVVKSSHNLIDGCFMFQREEADADVTGYRHTKIYGDYNRIVGNHFLWQGAYADAADINTKDISAVEWVSGASHNLVCVNEFTKFKHNLTVRSFWKFISKNWKFSFEEQRTSNGVSISLRTTARLIDKRPGKTIRKAGKFFNERKYKSL